MISRSTFAFITLIILGIFDCPDDVRAISRNTTCVAVNDRVTQLRIGKTRSGQNGPVNVPKAVEIGEAAAINCKDDDAFMLAYSLARIDLSAQVKFGTPAQRAEYFNSAIYDLRALDAKVRSGKSEHYEIFNVLGFIYYEAGQYQKSIEELNAAGPFLKKMSPISAQKTLITLGAAQGQLGQNDAGARSFDEAVTFGYPSAKAKELKRKMLGSHWAS